MKIQFWGVRSTATPDPDKVRYGGNSNCVVVTSDDAPDHYFVLDAGTGLARFSSVLNPMGAYSATMLLSHLHLFHIIGFQFTPLTYSKHSRTRVIGPSTRNTLLETVFDSILAPIFSPVYGRANLVADVEFEEVTSEIRTIEGVQIAAMPFDHRYDTQSWSYRLQDSSGIVVYMTDNELYDHEGKLRLEALRLCRYADVLIIGATDPFHYDGEGTSYADALALARAAFVKHLVLYHHHANATDEQLDRAYQDMCLSNPDLKITIAMEGLVIKLP